ncbi:orotate phosphoribosyltransferase [filamentous cyanobacterium CCP5]|nr:orotate phosphoribosyltransferase [filamentous cyanobacterium CCP5]
MDELLLNISASDLLGLETAALRSPLLDLVCRGAYQEGDFVLTSGQRSTYYINGKLVTLHPQGALLVGRLLLDLVPPETTAVAGLTLGADPLVTAVSLVGVYGDRTLFPLIIRKEAKGHGTQAYIEGLALPEGTAIAVLEDVVTTGGSAMKAVERLIGAGYRVNHVITLVDRLEGGRQLYEAKGLSFTSLYTIEDIQTRWARLQDSASTR